MEIKAENIQKAYDAITILNDISFSLEKGQKVGLVGNNGTGKSTLLKILVGEVPADSGQIIKRRGLVIGYMPQDTRLNTKETIRDYLRRISGIAELESCFASVPDAIDEYERRNGYVFDHRLEMILAGFGLQNAQVDRPVSELSSGQKSKVFMAGVLLSDPDVLLLDEPTNNLDLPALIWLENFLIRCEATCLIVSHDRLFLDRIVHKIFEIDWKKRCLNITNGRYSDYLLQIEKTKNRQLEAYKDQQEEIQRLTETARNKRLEAAQGSRYYGTDNDKFLRGFKRDRSAKSGKTAKALERRIEKIDRIEKPVERDLFRIPIAATKPEGSREITLQDVTAGYETADFKIGPISLNIAYGSRLVIMGLNGTGKSTLLKAISGELPLLSGDIYIDQSLVVGNLMQEHDNLPKLESLKSFLMQRGHLPVSDAYAQAVRFGFSAEEIEKKIEFLSPGGRSRLLFALFSALSVNVLLLDEPTNHLDIEALDALEEAIKHYTGTIILISHDRCFLQKFNPTDTYTLTEGKLSRQSSFEAYLINAEREAQRLIEIL